MKGSLNFTSTRAQAQQPVPKTEAVLNSRLRESKRLCMAIARRVLTAGLTLSTSARTMAAEANTTRSVPFILMGAGGVGSARLEAIVGARTLHAERYGLRFAALAVCDSSAAVSGADLQTGLADAEISALIAHKAAGGKLSSQASALVRPAEQNASTFLESVVTKFGGLVGPDAIVVDCTATDATVPALLTAAASYRAVSANKKPFASEMATFQQLALAPTSPARVRYEATVGAGLPVIAALSRVVSAHDATLIALLCALELAMPAAWPEYASMLRCELLERVGAPEEEGGGAAAHERFFVRFTLNGEPLAFSRACDAAGGRGPEPEAAEMLPLAELRRWWQARIEEAERVAAAQEEAAH